MNTVAKDLSEVTFDRTWNRVEGLDLPDGVHLSRDIVEHPDGGTVAIAALWQEDPMGIVCRKMADESGRWERSSVHAWGEFVDFAEAKLDELGYSVGSQT